MSTKFDKGALFASEWVSQAHAARLRGVSRQAIWRLVKRGRLKTLVFGGHTLVKLDDLEKFRPKLRGRPKKMKDKDDDS